MGKKYSKFLVLMFGGFLVLAACGSDEDTSTADGEDSTESTDESGSSDSTTDSDSTDSKDSGNTDSTDKDDSGSEEDKKVTPVNTDCSASGMSAPGTQNLPSSVAETRTQIINAAIACDYDGLEEVLAKNPGFKASFGDDDAIKLWKSGEENGTEPLKTLVNVLSTSAAETEIQDDTYYIWPAFFEEVFCEEPLDLLGDAIEDDMEKVGYSVNQMIDDCDTNGQGYLGYRTSITSDGTWQNYIAGD